MRATIHKIKLNAKWNRSSLAILLFLITIFSLFILNLLVGSVSISATPVFVSPVRINIPGTAQSKPIFRVYYPVNNLKNATELGNELAEKLTTLKSFSSVDVTYYLSIAERNRLIMRHDNESKFDLLLVKSDLLQRLTLQDNINYEPVAAYAGYSVYLISTHETPELNSKYLTGKTIGLLADPFSESGHKYPKNAIARNIKKENLPKFESKYSSHATLRKALNDNEVDLIASYWGKKQQEKYPHWKLLKIADVPKGDTWFLEVDINLPMVVCATTEALESMAKKAYNTYWKNIIILANCEGHHE